MDSFDPYKSTETTEIPLEQKLIAEQNIFGTILGSLVGAVPGFLIYLWLLSFPFYAVMGYFIPGLFIGLFAAFMGRGIDKVHRLASAAVTVIIASVIVIVFDTDSSIIALSLVNAVVAAFSATRWLSREQEDAIFDYKIGYRKTKKQQ